MRYIRLGVNKKYRDMPKPLKFPQKLLIGFTDELVAGVDAWRREQPDLPSRSEAIRRLVEQALKPKKR